jgi:diacylglycerol kinase
MQNTSITYNIKGKDSTFSFKKRFQSFGYAFNGLWVLFKYEHNSRIHLACALSAIISGLIFHLSIIEWITILILILAVFITEIINSAIENLADFVSPAYSEKIKVVKDLSAAAVFVSALISVIIGLLIFIPKIF